MLGSTASLLPPGVISTLKGKIDHFSDCLRSSVFLSRTHKKYKVQKNYLASVAFEPSGLDHLCSTN